MFDKIEIEKAILHAKKDFPCESVGVIVNNEYLSLKNIHDNPTEDFLVAEKDVLEIGIDKIQAIIHSHPVKEGQKAKLYPTAIDMQTQINFDVPFGIISCDSERASKIQWWGDACTKAPLVGRGFIHGIQDCYSLIRDYYKLELNIDLLEFAREWQWWDLKDKDLYVQGIIKTGFKEIPFSKMKKGDVFLMPVGLAAIRAGKSCHGGIYLGDDTILHHKCGGSPYDMGHLSAKENIHRYSKYFTHVLRHENMD